MRPVRLPASLHWSHHTHYHRWLLRRLPARIDRALDAGCGSSLLARTLARSARHVDAVDVSLVLVARGAARCPDSAGITWLVGDLLDPALPLTDAGYDVATAVSSVHHLPLRLALTRLAGLVRPGGVLLVVGHHRASTPTDHPESVLRCSPTPWSGCCSRSAGAPGSPSTRTCRSGRRRTRWPWCTVVDAVLPGARLRRGLFWRHLLVWHRPGVTPAGDESGVDRRSDDRPHLATAPEPPP